MRMETIDNGVNILGMASVTPHLILKSGELIAKAIPSRSFAFLSGNSFLSRLTHSSAMRNLGAAVCIYQATRSAQKLMTGKGQIDDVLLLGGAVTSLGAAVKPELAALSIGIDLVALAYSGIEANSGNVSAFSFFTQALITCVFKADELKSLKLGKFARDLYREEWGALAIGTEIRTAHGTVDRMAFQEMLERHFDAAGMVQLLAHDPTTIPWLRDIPGSLTTKSLIEYILDRLVRQPDALIPIIHHAGILKLGQKGEFEALLRPLSIDDIYRKGSRVPMPPASGWRNQWLQVDRAIRISDDELCEAMSRLDKIFGRDANITLVSYINAVRYCPDAFYYARERDASAFAQFCMKEGILDLALSKATISNGNHPEIVRLVIGRGIAVDDSYTQREMQKTSSFQSKDTLQTIIGEITQNNGQYNATSTLLYDLRNLATTQTESSILDQLIEICKRHSAFDLIITAALNRYPSNESLQALAIQRGVRF